MDQRFKFTFKISTFLKWGDCQCLWEVALVGWGQRLGAAAAPCGVAMQGGGRQLANHLLVICVLCSVPWFSQQSERAANHSHSFFCCLLISMFPKAVWSCFGLGSAVTRLSGQSVARLTPFSAHLCADTGSWNPVHSRLVVQVPAMVLSRGAASKLNYRKSTTIKFL